MCWLVLHDLLAQQRRDDKEKKKKKQFIGTPEPRST